jgi:hypothetical protein
MSKQQIRKFRKNDYSYDDDSYEDNPRSRQDKRQLKRQERALRVKDISALVEDEDDSGFENYYSTFEEEKL